MSTQGPPLLELQHLGGLRLSFLFVFFCLFRATPAAYGGSEARGPFGAVAAA